MRKRHFNFALLLAGFALGVSLGSCNEDAFNNEKTPAGQDATPGRTEENEYQPVNPTNDDTVRIDQDNANTETP